MIVAQIALLMAQAVVPGAVATPADVARVTARAQPVLDRYDAAVRRCGARPPFKPAIQVAASDGIIHYDAPTGRLVLYPWTVVGGEMKAVAVDRAARQGGDAREGYESIFNELLVAHELGHWLQGFQPERRTAAGRYDNWFAEQNANRLMVAFWRENPGSGATGRTRLESYVDRETPNPMPPPAGTSLEQFFTDDTMRIVRGGGYGWYQGEMTRRALAERPQPRFCALVAEWLPLRDRR